MRNSRNLAQAMAIVGVVAGGLYLLPVLWGRTLTGHESVQPQTSREMVQGGHWLIPTVGGDAWLERPPPPMWWIAGIYTMGGCNRSEALARLAAVLAALPTLLLTVAIAYRLFGGAVAIMAGLILATMHEFFAYAINPEADIFLCLLVTAVIATFVHLEFAPGGQRRAAPAASAGGLWGRRSWTMVLFFLLVGGTNWAKGLLFGSVMALAPVAAFLLSDVIQRRSWAPLQPYLWGWGILLALAAASAWPLAVIGQYPEIVQLWQEHYLGRLHRGYLREPWWYYAVQLPYVLLPWTLAALAGGLVCRSAVQHQAGRERFVVLWAVTTPLLLSLADGKHHHYLLYCLGGWAILAALGLRPLWLWCRQQMPSGLTVPVGGGLLSALLVAITGGLLRQYLPGQWATVVVATLFALLAGVVVLQGCRHRDPRRAFAAILAPVVAAYAMWIPYQAAFLDDYHSDLTFLQQAEQMIPDSAVVLVQFDWTAPLETFWVLYHLQRPGVLIRDPWQAAEKTASTQTVPHEAYVLARRLDYPVYAQAASVETLLESAYTRGEKQPQQRRVLYRLRFPATLPPAPEEYLRLVRRTLW
ncbi:MAG: glycosyltransferase family 39 protein [Gemmataceae bacterium]|nr:glycosyltransferase family 39 protein [Gemmataceae bacterium]MDW8242807.1 glycosyltransferase family 39 protein [Thermogemmata sp.]